MVSWQSVKESVPKNNPKKKKKKEKKKNNETSPLTPSLQVVGTDKPDFKHSISAVPPFLQIQSAHLSLEPLSTKETAHKKALVCYLADPE